MSKPQRAYDNWLEGYIKHQKHSESPLNFHLWTGIFTIAAALGRKVFIDELHFQWTPNMYIILVGPPGVAAKSTTMRQGISLLEHVEGVRFGPQSLTWQALLEAFSEAQTTVKFPGREDPQPMSCLSIGIGELGTFYNPDEKDLTDQLTALWDGQVEQVRRRTRKDGETIIKSPWLNLIGCTTPSWLNARFPKEAIGGGLTSRIVFVYGDQKRRRIAYPSQEPEFNNVQYERDKNALIHDLQKISQIIGEYKLTPEAYAHGKLWYDDLDNPKNLPEYLKSGRFEGYISRKQSHVHKLAIILAAAQRDELIITLDDLKKAERYVTQIEPDMARVFESIGIHESAQTLGEIETLVRNHKKISMRALYTQLYKTMDRNAFISSVDAAANAGVIKKDEILGEDGKRDFLLTFVGNAKKRKEDDAANSS